MATPRPAKRRPAPPVGRSTPAPDDGFHPRGATVYEPARPREDAPVHVRPGRFPKEAVAWLFVLGAVAYFAGWYTAYTGAVPGIFLASDIGLITVAVLLLRCMARIVASRIRATGLAAPSAAIPKAGAWGLSVFWLFATFTNVFQLAIGLGAGIFAYQLYATKSRLMREGYSHATRFGPAFAPTLVLLLAYAGWLLLRRTFGPLPGFDLVTAGAAVLLTILLLRQADHAAQRVAGTPARTLLPDATLRRSMEPRIITGVIVGYLFFRFFISSAIPYGPIVEWLLVCVGAVFIAFIMADRIGVVPTGRSLPRPELRTHIQRIRSLPDRGLEETDTKIQAFIRRGTEAAWVRQRFHDLFEDAGIPDAAAQEHLRPLAASSAKRRHELPGLVGPDAREALVGRLLEVLREKRGSGATGTLKTQPAVQREDKVPRPVVTPSP